MGHFFQIFSLPSHLAYCPYLVWLRALPDVHTYLLAKMDSSLRVTGSWQGILWAISPPFPGPWGPFAHVWSERSPWSQDKCGFLIFLYSSRACFCHYLYLEETGRQVPHLCLGAHYLLSHFQHMWPLLGTVLSQLYFCFFPSPSFSSRCRVLPTPSTSKRDITFIGPSLSQVFIK